jgi:hypothetical protein
VTASRWEGRQPTSLPPTQARYGRSSAGARHAFPGTSRLDGSGGGRPARCLGRLCSGAGRALPRAAPGADGSTAKGADGETASSNVSSSGWSVGLRQWTGMQGTVDLAARVRTWVQEFTGPAGHLIMNHGSRRSASCRTRHSSSSRESGPCEESRPSGAARPARPHSTGSRTATVSRTPLDRGRPRCPGDVARPNVPELAEVANGLTTAHLLRLAAAKILAGRVLLPHGRIPDDPGLRVPRIDAYRDLSDSDLIPDRPVRMTGDGPARRPSEVVADGDLRRLPVSGIERRSACRCRA